MDRFLSSLSLVALVVSIGCSKAVDRSMLFGTYTANHKKAIDYIELRPDGTYFHLYKGPDGKEYRNSNKWTFEYREGQPRITFSGFVFRLPGHESKQPGFWDVEVEKSWFGTYRLSIDSDLNYYYAKEKS